MIKSENSIAMGCSSKKKKKKKKTSTKTAKTTNISSTTMNDAPIEGEPPNIQT